VAATRAVLAEPSRRGDGRVALSGHSMAGEVIARTAALEPDVAAVVAISLFSPAVTAETPHKLFVTAGAREGRLAAEAFRVAGLASASEPPSFGVTRGRFADGTARRAVVAPGIEHVGVEFAPATLLETRRGFLLPLAAATAGCAAFTAELLGGSQPLIADGALPRGRGGRPGRQA